jgi:hypothetical protein
MSSRFCTRPSSCSWVCAPCRKGHKVASAVWNTVQVGTVAVGGGEACEALFSRGLEVNEMGCKLIISHGVVEKVKNGFNETRAQCTSTFFLTLKIQFCTRRHSDPHNRAVATLGKKTKLQLLGPEGELRKTHQWSRVKSTKFLHLEGRFPETNYNCQQRGREGQCVKVSLLRVTVTTWVDHTAP